MNISYLLTNRDKSLQFKKKGDTIMASTSREEQRDADYDGKNIADTGGYRQYAWQIGRYCNAPLPQKGNSWLQNWWTMVHQSRRLAKILGGAQTTQKIDSPEAKNVERPPALTSGQLTLMTPRTLKQLLKDCISLQKVTFSILLHHSTTQCNENLRKLLTVQAKGDVTGGKCGVMTITQRRYINGLFETHNSIIAIRNLGGNA